MTALQKSFISFIPSQTMRDYLSEMINNGNWMPSAEDMTATVYQSDRSIFDKTDFFRLLLDEELTDNTRDQLEEIIRVSEKVREYIDSSRYAFECDDENLRPRIFNGIRSAMKHLRKHGWWYINVIDKHKRGDERYIAELYIEDFVIIEALKMKNKITVCSKLGDRYVKFPVPFDVGDVVYYTGNKAKLFCVVNADLPSTDMQGTDFIDSSITVIPYEYREYAAPEFVREHYKRCKSPSTYVHDVISEQHDHMCVTCAELYEKYNKGE